MNMIFKITMLMFILNKAVESCHRTTPRPDCNVMPSSVFPSFKGESSAPTPVSPYFKGGSTTPSHNKAPAAPTTTTVTQAQKDDDVELSSCGQMAVDPESAIIKGRNAANKAWPWMGLVRGEHGICGGTLISDSWVLTAAHCVPGALSISFGQSDKKSWNENSQYRFPSQEIVHRHYDRQRKTTDLAMVKLDKPVNITEYVRPVCLPYNNISYSFCYAIGWGRDSLDSVYGSRFLKQLRAFIMPNHICAYKWMMDGLFITNRQVCLDMNVEGAGLCSGDSGSSLSCKSGNRYYVTAVASFVEKGCRKKFYPDVYTRILPYLDWVKTVMKEQK